MTDRVDERVRAIVARLARRTVPEIAHGATWRALDVDSLDLLEFATECEAAFALAIPDEALIRFRGPDDVIAWLSARC